MALLNDCEKCMETTTRETRQTMGCGFEPAPVADVHVEPWLPQGFVPDKDPKFPTTCIGYLRQLPEVLEVCRAHMHWNKGQLEAFCGGAPTEALVMAIEILEFAIAEKQNWLMTPARDGGGGS